MPKPPKNWKLETAYIGLRSRLLSITSEQLGEAAADAPVLFVAMEMGFPNGCATLACVCDGAVSIYFSGGGGMIGAGARPEVAEAALSVLDLANEVKGHLQPTDETPYPADGFSQFFIGTPNGLLHATEQEDVLGNGPHALHQLFHACHNVIGLMRQIDEQQQ